MTRAFRLPPGRYAIFTLCCILLLVALGLGLSGRVYGLWIAVPLAALVILGAEDLRQSRHSIRRNYPIIGHFRWWIEAIRPEIRQYLIEADEEAAPFSRSQRALVYERAKGMA